MDKNTSNQLLITKKHVARLESKIDMLESERVGLQGVLMQIGFPQGITSLREAAYELLLDYSDTYPDSPSC